MTRREGFGAHVWTALTAAILLVLVQCVLETALIVFVYRGFIITPYLFFPTEIHDFCAKLLFALPGASDWLRGGFLDRFVYGDLLAKIGVGVGLLLPNVIVGGGLGVLVAAVRWRRGRPAAPGPVLGVLAVFGLVVHLVSFAFAVHVPEKWTVSMLARNMARTLVYDHALAALVVFGTAVGLSVALLRLQPRRRRAVSLGAASSAAAMCLFVFVAAGGFAGSTVDTRGRAVLPNAPRVDRILLISIDSLRADRLGCYGNQRDTSPTIDRLAREGVRFADTLSTTSWTLPAHMSLLTGRHILSHGVLTDTHRLPPSVPTLAELLQERGLRTGGIVSMEYLEAHYGFGRGFDHYNDQAVPNHGVFAARRNEPAPIITGLAENWLREHAAEPFFLFLHYWDVHYDYIPPPPYDTMFDPDYDGDLSPDNFYHNRRIRADMPERDLEHVLAWYDGEIRWVDDHLARLVRALEELGVFEQTAIIVTSDHGDEFFEHGFKGHRRTLYREVVHIPLVMRVPGSMRGHVVEEPTSIIDVMPTILDLAAVETPPGIDGASLAPALSGRSLRADRSQYGELYEREKLYVKAMQRTPEGALMYDFLRPRVQFYERSDASEKRNLARGNGWPRAGQLRALTQWLNVHWGRYRGLDGERETIELDAAMQERLRALGYAD